MVRIEKQTATEITLPPMERIEFAARVCYRSQASSPDPEKRKSFLMKLAQLGHMTPFEHAAIVVRNLDNLLCNGVNARSRVVTDFLPDGAYQNRLNVRTLIENVGVETAFDVLTSMDNPVQLDPAYVTFEIITNRGIGNQLIRHRAISFESTDRLPDPSVNQESLRWVLMDDPVVVLGDSAIAMLEEDPDMKQQWLHSVSQSFAAYKDLTGKCKKEFARTVLPLATYTRIIMTADLHGWWAFLKLRLDKAADPQMRDLAGSIYSQLKPRLISANEDLTSAPFCDV